MSFKNYRRWLFERDGGKCFWCRCETRLEWPGWERGGPTPNDGATIDHIKPKSVGGKYLPKNVVLSCYKCNYEKKDTWRRKSEVVVPR